jgi:two-component system CheB/CheR fusion protein
MKLHGFSELSEYLTFLQQDPASVRALADDIFIHVTQFFRDPESFDFLQNEILPKMNSDRISTVPLRIWVPGCSTGEEAYSIAISLFEFCDRIGEAIPFQIFATDISERAVAKGRSGFYHESEMDGISERRRAAFFEKYKDGYKVKKALRDGCVFSRHDLINNPPFARMNLISCRNVLIYFDANLQKQVLPVFHYSLGAKGYLWLGRTEAPASISKLFSLTNKTHKVFSKIGSVNPDYMGFPINRHVQRVGVTKKISEPSSVDQQKEIDRIVFARYAPAGVVVNEEMEIVQVRGHTSPYLELPGGTPSNNLLKMVRPELLPGLRMAIQSAKKTGLPTRREGLAYGTAEERKSVAIEIVPLNTNLLIFFEEPKHSKKKTKSLSEKVKAPVPADAKDAYIAELIGELDALRDYQQSMSEGYEATQAELTAANEELQSTLEEFQSTNEELDTAREEMQAANEELSTVNEDLHARNEQLAKSEERFRLLVEAVSEYAIFMLDSEGRVSSWNEGARRLKGYEYSEIVGQNFSKFYLPEDVRSGHPKEELEIARREGKYQEEGWRLRKDGSRFWASVLITRINDSEGQLLGFSKVTRDLTDRKMSEIALKEANEGLEKNVKARTAELQEALRVRDEFLSVASHELKTPLTALKLEVQMAKKSVQEGDRTILAPERLVAFATQLDRKVNKLKALVDDMLDVSRIQRGALTLRPKISNLSDLIREVVRTFSSEIHKAGSELRLQIEDGINCFCDRARIEQVVLNLLSNAAKYGAGKPIALSCYREDTNAVLLVKDHGIGISKDDQERIFGRFERAISSSEASGLGLGLYITKQILTLHQATISVKSERGQGSEFTIILPLNPRIESSQIQEQDYEF